MDCARARDVLHAWLDGELERDVHCEVVGHLAVCEQCDARFKEEQRLLARVKAGLACPCPDELRARLLERLGQEPVRARASILSFGRFAAAAAVFVVAFVWTDPVCLRGCPTVRALALERTAPVDSADCLDYVKQKTGWDMGECKACCRLVPVGYKVLSGCGCRSGCMVRLADEKGRVVCFFRMKEAHVHRWLALNANAAGIILTAQDGCRFAGWTEPDGEMCAFVSDESVAEGELVALAEQTRRSE
jgi:hypothetical protein